MILTQLHLNARRRGAQKLLGSPQAMHAAVLAGFPPGVDPGKPLWRVDADDPLRPALLVLSKERPDFTHIEEQGGWPSTPTARSASYSGLLDRLAIGQEWGFRLTANPSHYATIHGVKKLVGHVTVAQQQQWLLDRAERMGVDFGPEDEPTVIVVNRDTRRFRHGERGRITFTSATYRGTLRITNVDALREVLTGGLGRKRAYGCGLLTLARP